MYPARTIPPPSLRMAPSIVRLRSIVPSDPYRSRRCFVALLGLCLGFLVLDRPPWLNRLSPTMTRPRSVSTRYVVDNIRGKSWRCPRCGNRLLGYRPVLASVAHHLAAEIGTPQVFFFDRVSRGALTLARVAAARGAAIVFEPSGVGHPALFREAWEIAHVVKYSHERLQELPAEVEAINGAHSDRNAREGWAPLPKSSTRLQDKELATAGGFACRRR